MAYPKVLHSAAGTILALSAAAFAASRIDAQQLGAPIDPSNAELVRKHDEMIKSMRPLCRERDADIKAHRKPKKFNAFLLDFPPALQDQIRLLCDSL